MLNKTTPLIPMKKKSMWLMFVGLLCPLAVMFPIVLAFMFANANTAVFQFAFDHYRTAWTWSSIVGSMIYFFGLISFFVPFCSENDPNSLTKLLTHLCLAFLAFAFLQYFGPLLAGLQIVLCVRRLGIRKRSIQ